MKRAHLSPAVLDIVRDLLTDARCAYRDARQFPASAEALIPYAEQCRRDARRIMYGAPVTLDRYGWPVIASA